MTSKRSQSLHARKEDKADHRCVGSEAPDPAMDRGLRARTALGETKKAADPAKGKAAKPSAATKVAKGQSTKVAVEQTTKLIKG